VVNGKLQPSFALETTPYYWVHKKDKQDDSAKFDPFNYMVGNWRDNIVRSLTFSLASSESDTFTFGDIDPGTGYAFGLHFTIFSERLNKNTARQIFAWTSNFQQSFIIDEMISKLKSMASPPEKINYKTQVRNWVRERKKAKSEEYSLQASKLLLLLDHEFHGREISIDDLEEFRQVLTDEGADFLAEINKVPFPITRDGFSLDFALAASGIFQGSEFERFQYAKTSIWVTPSYRFVNRSNPRNIFDVMGVVRLTLNNELVDRANYLEGGLRLQHTWNRFSLSGEAIARYLNRIPEGMEKGYTWRFDVSMDYKVTDNITFKATFGSNFDGNSTYYSDPKKLFAVGGFNFGFGNLFH
jgi:hypothetical protein